MSRLQHKSALRILFYILSVYVPGVTGNNQCDRDSDCNQVCSFCVDDSINPPYGRCIHAFPFMYNSEKNCSPLDKCMNDCSGNHGVCYQGTGEFPPSCSCVGNYYDVSCDKEAQERQNTEITYRVLYKFQRDARVCEPTDLEFTSFDRQTASTGYQTLYATLENDEGYYARVKGSRAFQNLGIDVERQVYDISITFPFKPYINDSSSEDILTLKDTVLGYLANIDITVRSGEFDFYKNRYAILVSYEGTELRCVPVIKFKNCGKVPTNPVRYYRESNIEIETSVQYIADGRYASLSFHELNCGQDVAFTWEVWRLLDLPHSEEKDKVVYEYTGYRNLHYSPFEIKLGTYKIKLQINNVTPFGMSKNFAYCYFKIAALPLEAIIDGGRERTVYKPYGFILSASRSHDPNMPSSTQDHVYVEWRCSNLIQPNLDELCKPKQMKAIDRYYILPRMLTYGATYQFVLEVRTDMYTYSPESSYISPKYDYVKIRVASETETPPYEILIICVENCGVKVLPNDILFLKASIKGNTSIDDTLVWLYSKEGGSEKPTNNIRIEDVPDFMLIIKENSLDIGANYTITLEVQNSKLQGGLIPMATYLFETDKNNYEGLCSVEPRSGIQGRTAFSILCEYNQNSTYIYEFYDKNTEEVEENIEYNGRMLGTSYDGVLHGVFLTRGNVIIYILDHRGLSVSRHIIVRLAESIISHSDLAEHDTFTIHAIRNEDFFSVLQVTSYIPDVIPLGMDIHDSLTTLARPMIKIPSKTLANVKLGISTLYNVLSKLNDPNHLVICTNYLVISTLRFLNRLVYNFNSFVLNRVYSRWTSSREIRQMASSIFTCLDHILSCRDPLIERMRQDGFKFQTLNKLKTISELAEKTIEYTKDTLSYLQISGEPPRKISSKYKGLTFWGVENDDEYPITEVLKKHEDIPVNISDLLFKTLQNHLLSITSEGLKVNTDLGLQVVEIDKNIFWWCESDAHSNLVLASLSHRVNETRRRSLSSLPVHIDLYATLNNISDNNNIIYTTIQVDPDMNYLERDLRIIVHRIDRVPHSRTTLTFRFPQTNSTLRVLATDKLRPDFASMLKGSVNISRESPKYPHDIYNNKDYSSFIFVGILPGLEVPVNESVTYSFEVNSVVCQFWAKGQWSSFGCHVYSESEGMTVHCQCNHVSIFSVAFKVPPQEVNVFEDVHLFLTVYDNPLVVSIVLSLLLIYFILCIFLRKMDQRDKALVEVVVLRDNFPGDLYPYLIAVRTSSRFDAGTTAHVGLTLNGTSGTSRAHVLSAEKRKVLKKNSDDWFLLNCPNPLGELEYVHIWHDNYGSSPNWYCDKIHVFDLKSRIETIFIVDQWLALDLTQYPEAVIRPISDEDFAEKKVLFVDNISLELREHHLFLCIFFKHPRNPISRVQIISVLMSCVMLVMLCSIMFYLPEDKELNVDDPQFTFGTREFYVTFQSILIISITTLILFTCFRRSYKYVYVRQGTSLYIRRDAYSLYKLSKISGKDTFPTQRSIILPTDQKNYGQSEHNNCFKMMAASLISPDLPPVLLPPISRIVKVRKPWYIFSWGCCITIIFLSVFFVMLYGLKLGLVNSEKWLSTVLASEVGEILVISPVKFMFYAIILTIASKRMRDVFTHAVDYKKALKTRIPNIVEYLEEVIKKREQHMYAPLSRNVRIEMVIKKQQISYWLTLADFMISTCFVFIVSAIISHLWSSSCYVTNSQVKKLLTLSHYPEDGTIDFFKISSTSDVEKYLEYTLESILYTTRWYNDRVVKERSENNTPGREWSYWSADFSNKLLGLAVLRQFRVVARECHIFGKQEICIPELSDDTKDTDVYDIGWTPILWSEVRNDSPWVYTDDEFPNNIFALRLYGESGKLHERGGYTVELGPTRREADVSLVELREHHWQDVRTRVVIVELSLYNVNEGTINHVTLIVENLVTGNTLLKVKVDTVKRNMRFVILTILLVVYILFYVSCCLFSINRRGLLVYLSDPGNVLYLLVICLSLTTLTMYVLSYRYSNNYFTEFLKQGTYTNFDYDVFTYYLIRIKISASILLSLAITRVLTLLRFGRTLINYYYSFVLSIKWIFFLTLVTVLFINVTYFLVYSLNMFLIYDIQRLVQVYRSTARFRPTDPESSPVRLFVILKSVSLNLIKSMFIILFLYYTQLARYHRPKVEDQFNFIYFLFSRRKIKIY